MLSVGRTWKVLRCREEFIENLFTLQAKLWLSTGYKFIKLRTRPY